MARIRRIRSRDYLLVDTLDQQYETAYREMYGPYTTWREARLSEVNTIREVESEANQRVATGIGGCRDATAPWRLRAWRAVLGPH